MEIPLTHGPTGPSKNDGRIYATVNVQHPSVVTSVSSPSSTTGSTGTLRCCFISDVTSDKSAASICVNAGQLHDPPNRLEGIAHLTEHLLFMGSKTYPKENDYDNYIQQYCGGSTNAYTDLHNTVYYFDIMNSSNINENESNTGKEEEEEEEMAMESEETRPDNDGKNDVEREGTAVALSETDVAIDGITTATTTTSTSTSTSTTSTTGSTSSKLQGAIHRLLCALSEPLLSLSSIEREILAVDSEHSKNLTQDHWRVHQLSRTILGQRRITDPNDTNHDMMKEQYHPYANFGTGNKASLLQQATKKTSTPLDGTGDQPQGEDQPPSEERYAILQKGVLEFFQTHYTFSNMTFCLLSNLSVEEMQHIVHDVLSKIPLNDNNSSPHPFSSLEIQEVKQGGDENRIVTAEIPPLPDMSHVTMVQWVPMRGGNCYPLELQWILPMPLYSQYYTCKPARYYSHLLGHEGPGSLLYVLREKQWVQDLTADDTSTDTKSFTIFTLSMDLTSDGLQHVTDIIEMIFYYIDIILKEIPVWVHEELQVTGDTSFKFMSKYDAAHTVSMMACNMHQFSSNPNHYLSGPYKIFEYNPSMIQSIGQSLRSTTTNLLILLGSTTFAELTDQIDPWYGTQYRIVPITDVDHHVWVQYQKRISNDVGRNSELTTSLRLPDPNDMLPTNFNLLTSSENMKKASYLWNDTTSPFHDAVNSSPRCIVNNETCRLWYKPDTIYQSPKVNMICLFRTPILSCSTSSSLAVMATMFVEIVSELCNEFSYAASMAGLHCGFRESLSNCGCIELTISGYNHKCHTLLHRICDTIQTTLPSILSPNQTDSESSSTSNATPDLTNQFFERIRNKVEQRYESTLVAQPYQHGSMVADLILDATNYGSVYDKLSFVRNKTLLTCQDMLHFSKQLLSCFHLEVLVHGNVLPNDALKWTNIILDKFQPTPPSRLMIGRGIVIPDSVTTTIYRDKGWNEHDENSCIVNIYQVGLVDIPLNAKMSLLLQLLREPAFNMLRTEEQLGYIVFTSVKTVADNVKSLMFLIQSDSYDPIHMNGRIEHFLSHFRNSILMEMSDADFMMNVSSLCDSMLEKSKNLSEETMKHWNVIQNRTYYFQRINDIVNVLRKLQKIDIIRFFDHYVLASSPHRRKLSIQLFGTAHESIRQELISTTKSDENDGAVSMNSTTGTKATSSSTTTDEIMIDQRTIDEFISSRPLYPAQKVGSIQDFMLTLINEEEDTTSKIANMHDNTTGTSTNEK